jgi:hypothetical protein
MGVWEREEQTWRGGRCDHRVASESLPSHAPLINRQGERQRGEPVIQGTMGGLACINFLDSLNTYDFRLSGYLHTNRLSNSADTASTLMARGVRRWL